MPHLDRRRCRSMPPWSLQDVKPAFYLELGDNLYVDDADVDLRNYTVCDVMRIPSSVVLFLDDKFVLKMRLATFDIERVVNLMRLASTVVPVPQVYKYGHSGNCTFILMERIHGLEFGYVRRYIHCSEAVFMARIEKQIDNVVRRLATVGLSHNDLVPRNIIFNDTWEIIGIVDWDYCTAFNPAHEYILHLETHIWGYQEGKLRHVQPIHWNHLYMRQVTEYRSVMDFVDSRHILHGPPLLKYPRTRITRHSGDHQSPKPRLLLDPSQNRRIAIMSSMSSVAVRHLMEACDAERIPKAVICLLFSYRAEQLSPFAKDRFPGATFPIIHLPMYHSAIDIKGKTWRDYDEDVGQLIVRERPDVIIQLGWTLRMLESFWEAMQLPRLLRDDLRPVPFVWICTGLPSQLRHLSLAAEEIIPSMYQALQRKEFENTGFSVWEWRNGHFKIKYTREVEVKSGESFVEFEARMLGRESRILEEVASDYLDGKDYIPS